MKVLMVISQFHPIIGGAERQAQFLAQKLIEKGLQVKVVTGWWKLRTPRKETINGVKVFRNFCCWGLFGIRGMRFLGVFFYAISLGIYLLTNRKEYDIIHVHQVLYPAFISTFIAKGILKKPVLAKMGCSGLTSDIRNLKRFPFGSLQLRYLIKKLDYLVTVNNEGGEEFHALGYPSGRILSIPNGVALPSDGKGKYDQVLFVITTVRLDKQKGIDILLKAWAGVVTHENNLNLLIIGKGPHERELKDLCQSLGISDSVKFMGEVIQVEEQLKKSDIFVLASRAEGMSNSLLEAMSHGLTCIATNISGNAELMGMGENSRIPKGNFTATPNGLLFQPEDIDGLTKAILFLVRNPKKRENLGRSGRQYIQKNFSIDLVAEKYITLYQRMLNRKS
ncbi:MAG: glycosyltransferase family 4 protein [Thermodesulfobacteriota bacterium]|jgi:glycosyltransferase involved in cell wall biosynthesis